MGYNLKMNYKWLFKCVDLLNCCGSRTDNKNWRLNHKANEKEKIFIIFDVVDPFLIFLLITDIYLFSLIFNIDLKQIYMHIKLIFY